MNLNEFQELSKRTMPYNGEPTNQVEFENMLGNYAMGLSGETSEAYMMINNREQLLLELGDIAHYAVGLLLLAKIEIPQPLRHTLIGLTYEEQFKSLIRDSGEIVEHVKKVIYHRHEFNADTFQAAVRILKVIRSIARIHNSSLDKVLQMNIDKLKTRYPESFNTADSINRVDVASNK